MSDIEIYKPLKCRFCSANIFLRGFEFETGWKVLAFNFIQNIRHLCYNPKIDEEIAIKNRP